LFEGIPIIGIAGGIGSGKSHVARLFGQLGCVVIDSDAQVAEAYRLPAVRSTLQQWWGDAVFRPDGSINRHEIARRIFGVPEERRRLEGLLHPVVAQLRDVQMGSAVAAARAGQGASPVAFVWDTPLLFETGLNAQCDAVVYVDTPRAIRLRRVQTTRGWDDAELTRRENSQWPLDKKQALSHYVVANTAPGGESADGPALREKGSGTPYGGAVEAPLRDQVRLVLSRIIEVTRGTARPKGIDFTTSSEPSPPTASR
jgi:dephospho-CoA kinase